MPRPMLGLPIKYYTREDIIRIADMSCEYCRKSLRECQCPDDDLYMIAEAGEQ